MNFLFHLMSWEEQKKFHEEGKSLFERIFPNHEETKTDLGFELTEKPAVTKTSRPSNANVSKETVKRLLAETEKEMKKNNSTQI